MNKTKRILEYLQTGRSITNMAAMQLYGETRLGDVIYRLRKQGYQIDTTMVEREDEEGKTVYGVYTLSKTQNDN